MITMTLCVLHFLFSLEFINFKISHTWLEDPSDILGCWNQASVVDPLRGQPHVSSTYSNSGYHLYPDWQLSAHQILLYLQFHQQNTTMTVI